MATRKSLKEAEELKTRWEAQGYTIKVFDRSETREIPARFAEYTSELEILEGRGDKVLVSAPCFEVLEEVTCRDCGTTFYTKAVGEIGRNVCLNCREQAHAKFQGELKRRDAEEAARVAAIVATNEMEEPE
jgi:hypothetical protein